MGVMAVPQCVSFALMAGLPSVYGLYSAFLPVLAYALTGSSPQLVSNGCSNNQTSPCCHNDFQLQLLVGVQQLMRCCCNHTVSPVAACIVESCCLSATASAMYSHLQHLSTPAKQLHRSWVAHIACVHVTVLTCSCQLCKPCWLTSKKCVAA